MCLVAIKYLDHNNTKLYILYIVNNALLRFFMLKFVRLFVVYPLTIIKTTY